jgi:hypothetical protein
VLQWQYAGACDGVTDFTSIVTPPHAHRPLSSGVPRDDSGRIRSQRRLIKWLCFCLRSRWPVQTAQIGWQDYSAIAQPPFLIDAGSRGPRCMRSSFF